MKMKDIILGLVVTLCVDVLAVASVGRDEIIVHGFYLAMAIIFCFSCVVRVMVASATPDAVSSTNWKGVASYAVGALVATGGMIGWYNFF